MVNEPAENTARRCPSFAKFADHVRVKARSLVVSFLCVAASTAAADPLTGRWLVTADAFGVPQYFNVQLSQAGDALTGDFAGDKLTGTVKGVAIQLLAKDTDGGSEQVTGTLDHATITGTINFVEGRDPAHPFSHPFTATLASPRASRQPRRQVFTPTTYAREFSSRIKPVLTVAPGDTIATSTVDAAGADAKGIRRVLGGNPQTGPFYVEGALPGDTLVVRLVRVRLNRDYALSDDGIVSRAMDSGLAVKAQDLGNDVRWHLDVAKGVATTEKPGDHLGKFTVPLRPMLGCIATAVAPSDAPPGAQDSGGYGGNMDFNEAVEGATVYLPVSNPGALLYFGDGHAAQGDGELNGNALETSLDVEVTVDVIPNSRIRMPRLESGTHLMAMGLAGSLDAAFASATANMAAWLADRYKLTPSELAQVLGTSAEYHVSEAADRNAGVVVFLRRDRLKTLTPVK
jgi:amidase